MGISHITIMQGVGVAFAATLLLAPMQAYAEDAGHQPVSSDGSIIVPLKNVYRSFSPSKRPMGKASDARAEFKGGDTPEEAARLSRLEPTTAPQSRESIIGTDDRVRIDDTTSFPASATALVTFDGGFCTGWVINANTVATAGHCVHTGGTNGTWRTNVVVYPGRNGVDSPYGSCSARSLYSTAGWTSDANDEYDYGAIKLNCSIGRSTGVYGFFWQQASLDGLPTIINAYPGDKSSDNSYEQWQSLDEVRVTEPRRVFYENDTEAGMSGGPVYYNRTGCGICSMAIHTYGSSDINHGTRITQAVFNNLMAWSNAP